MIAAKCRFFSFHLISHSIFQMTVFHTLLIFTPSPKFLISAITVVNQYQLECCYRSGISQLKHRRLFYHFQS